MEGLREQTVKDITALSYLERLDEGMIWDSYKEVVPMAIAEIAQDEYQPATIQLLNRFNGRIILEIRKPQAAAQGSVSREEYDELKSLVGKLVVGSEKKFDELLAMVSNLQSELVQVQEVNTQLRERIKQLDVQKSLFGDEIVEEGDQL